MICFGGLEDNSLTIVETMTNRSATFILVILALSHFPKTSLSRMPFSLGI
jgi:hypothetical protein